MMKSWRALCSRSGTPSVAVDGQGPPSQARWDMTASLGAITAVAVILACSPQLAVAQSSQGLFWQCVAADSTHPQPSYCPVNSTYPLPVATSGSSVPNIGITPTDRTVTSATGASQTLMAANTSRHSLTVVNTGNANCGVNPTGGTAAIGGAGTLTLAPLGAYTPMIPTLSAVTVICTAGQPIYANEN